MLTVDKLKEFGANTEEGLARCLNNESFYLRLVLKSLEDAKIQVLASAIDNKNYKEAFEAAHSLKGVFGNLALTPLFNIAVELVEDLRVEKDVDYKAKVDLFLSKVNELKALNN